jgi:hypothetical protein
VYHFVPIKEEPVLKLLHKPSLLPPRNHAAELDLVYSDSAPVPIGPLHRFRQWFYNYVLPVLAILSLPLLILPLVATFILACARMHHDEPDSELYGSEPINGPVQLEDPQQPREILAAPVVATSSTTTSDTSYHWN